MSALIIPCYIKSQFDIDCLKRLLNTAFLQAKQFEKIYLIDDDSPLKYDIKFDSIEYITLDKNGGPARARNIGIKRALEDRISYILFTDHDCILDKNWNKEMTLFLEQNDFGAVGGMTYSFGTTIYDYYHNINGTLSGKWLLPDKKELWYMPSLNFGMKNFVAEQFQFDERFPTAAGEDVDLCLRLRSKYKIGFCASAELWHDYGYKNNFDFIKFINLFKKYKSSSATIYEGHTILMWDYSESIYEGNMHDSNL